MDQNRVEINEVAQATARKALALNWPKLEQSNPKYGAIFHVLTHLYCEFSAESFELRYNLRPPKDRLEKWNQQFMHGKISEAEFGELLRGDAKRPIDLEMLPTFCHAYEEELEYYSGILQNAVVKPSEIGTSVLNAKEKIIDGHIVALSEKLPL